MFSIRKSVFCVLSLVIIAAVFFKEVGHCRRSLKEGIRFNVGAGYGNYDMKRGELRILPPGEFVFHDYPFKRIEGGRELYGEIMYAYSRKFSFGSGIYFSSRKMNLSEWMRLYEDDYYTPRPEPAIYKTSIMAPYLKFVIKPPVCILKISFNGSIYYGFGTLNAQVRTYSIPAVYRNFTFKSRGTGYSISSSISFDISDAVAFQNTIGYRYLENGKLENQDGKKIQNFKLNFSGYFIRAGISIIPWGR